MVLLSLIAGVEQAYSATCQGPNRHSCCPASDSLTQGGFYCYDTQQAVATNGVLTTTIIPDTIDDVLCKVEFNYTWGANCSSPRDLRLCWSMCQAQTPCGSACFTRCQEVQTANNGGLVSVEQQWDNFVSTNECVACKVVVVDVTGNTSCNPVATSPCVFGFAGPCASNCGTPVLHGETQCEEIN